MTPIKSIRAKCLECCCGSYDEIKHCNILKCPLYPYRLEKRPKLQETPTDIKAQ